MAVDTKLSDLTELSAAPASTDEVYLNDGGTSKKITVANLFSGKQTIWVPVSEMYPSTSAGCAVLAKVETTAGRPDFYALDFDTTTEQHAQWVTAMPKRWNLGTVTFQAFWTVSAAGTGGLDGVVWGLEAVAVTADGTIDVAYGTEVVVGIDAEQTLEDLWMTAESGAVTIAGTPADDDLVFFQISRVTGSSTPLDDMDADARLLGVKLFWTSDIGTDD
ncbi:hypothetical protein LCGC14_2891230 [marine sediment metagenome]|uniref:Uncharacterized protein n=1 Tax=marine sediment metagenome TaxID=412755 RepID=A0A0F8YIY6_9ZZZZ